ncbi:MAG: tetratricopeptide repeat protein [Acidobacteria bacterium]|nr:tetratricopeptide repeat protein [Acidobacteriota bacterium]
MHSPNAWSGLFVLWGLLACVIPPAHAQPQGSVRGLVTGAQGDPIADAAVTVMPLGLTAGRHDVTTDVEGRFEHTGLPPGHYTVSAETRELGSQIFRVRVQADGIAEIRFVLGTGRTAAAWLRAPGDDRTAAAAAFESGVRANRAGDVEQAIHHFEAALQVMPSCLDCYFNIGVAHSGQERFEAAEAAFRQALTIRADYAAAYYGLAAVFAKQNRTDEAAAARGEANRITVQTLDASRNQARDTLARGQAFLNSGNVADAIRQFEGALVTDRTLVDAYYWLGRAQAVNGDPSAARLAFDRYLGTAPGGEFADDARLQLEALDR